MITNNKLNYKSMSKESLQQTKSPVGVSTRKQSNLKNKTSKSTKVQIQTEEQNLHDAQTQIKSKSTNTVHAGKLKSPTINNQTKNSIHQSTKQICNENEKLKLELASMTKKYDEIKKQVDLLDFVRPNEWLNDEPFQLYFNVIESRCLYPTKKIQVLNPCISQAIKFTGNVAEYLDPLHLKEKELLIMPVNNSSELMKERGSHWSLLCYDKRQATFYHYDSSKTIINFAPASELAVKLSCYFNLETPHCIKPINGPIQDNGYDCGIYITLATEFIVRHALSDDDFNWTLPSFESKDCLIKRALMSYILHHRHNLPKTVLDTLLLETWKTNISKYLPSEEEKALPNRSIPNKSEIKKDKEVLKHNKCKNTTKHDNPASHAVCLRNVNRKKCPSMMLVSDSQGRDVATLLDVLLGERINVIGEIHTGAQIETLINKVVNSPTVKNYTKNDWVVFMGGCNNIDSINERDTAKFYELIREAMKTLITSMQHTNCIISTIPYRYDLQCDMRQDLISKVNHEIRQFVYKHSYVFLLDLYLLNRFHHSNQGYHINRRGKRTVSRLIKDIFFGESRTHVRVNISGEKDHEVIFHNTDTNNRDSRIFEQENSFASATDESVPSTARTPWKGWPFPIPRLDRIEQISSGFSDVQKQSNRVTGDTSVVGVIQASQTHDSAHQSTLQMTLN